MMAVAFGVMLSRAILAVVGIPVLILAVVTFGLVELVIVIVIRLPSVSILKRKSARTIYRLPQLLCNRSINQSVSQSEHFNSAALSKMGHRR